MTTDTLATNPTLSTVAVVARNPRANVLDAVLDNGDYDVVFIESVDNAYSQIKRSNPRVVIVCLDMDDPDCCQILSMLKLDPDTSRIPLITYVTEPAVLSSRDRSLEIERSTTSQPIISSMN